MKKKIEELALGAVFTTVGGFKQKITNLAIDVTQMCPCCGRPLIDCEGRLMCPSIVVEVTV